MPASPLSCADLDLVASPPRADRVTRRQGPVSTIFDSPLYARYTPTSELSLGATTMMQVRVGAHGETAPSSADVYRSEAEDAIAPTAAADLAADDGGDGDV